MINNSLERFSFESRKTKTKAITLTNHNTENSAMNQSKFEENAGKHVRSSHDWFWFSFSLVKKVARVLLTNHREQESKTKAISKLLSTLN